MSTYDSTKTKPIFEKLVRAYIAQRGLSEQDLNALAEILREQGGAQ